MYFLRLICILFLSIYKDFKVNEGKDCAFVCTIVSLAPSGVDMQYFLSESVNKGVTAEATQLESTA